LVSKKETTGAKMNIQQLFKLGMKRDLPELLEFSGTAFDIGATGKIVAPGAIPLGLPDWSFPFQYIPAKNSTVATIHCYHFLEHLSGTDAIAFLRECERVMIPGQSVMNFCIPFNAIEELGRNRHVSCGSIKVAHAFQIVVDPEDLLANDNAALRFVLWLRQVRAELKPVLCGDVYSLTHGS